MTNVKPRRIEWHDARLPDSFWQQAIREDEHWLWGGAKFDNGYGKVKRQGKTWRVHRLVYTLSYGPCPTHVLHRCDVPLCFKPRHLFNGTHRDNMDDMLAKDRSCRGRRNTKAKLTDDQVIEIRRLYATGHHRQVDLAQQFNVHQTAISHITRGASWKHLTTEYSRA